MGEVYRARDTRLQRDIAIKILPEIFASDSDRLARFEREAQALAALEHLFLGSFDWSGERQVRVENLATELVRESNDGVSEERTRGRGDEP